jgi:hypothetical protein
MFIKPTEVDAPEANGHGTIHVSKYHGGIVASSSDDPLPRRDIYFATKDGYLESSSERLQYPNQLTPGKDYSVAFGGQIFDSEGKLKLVKLYYDSKGGAFETIYGDRFSLHNTYIVTPVEKLGTYKYNVKLQPFLQRAEYAGLNRPAYVAELTNVIKKYPLPTFLDQCLDIYQSDMIGHVIVRCSDSEVVFPNYLKPFLGDHSPIYHHGNYGTLNPESYHEITGSELKFIISLMTLLMMRKELISVDKLITDEVNIDEWIHICNYFDIPYFEACFKEIRSVLTKFIQ